MEPGAPTDSPADQAPTNSSFLGSFFSNRGGVAGIVMPSDGPIGDWGGGGDSASAACSPINAPLLASRPVTPACGSGTVASPTAATTTAYGGGGVGLLSPNSHAGASSTALLPVISNPRLTAGALTALEGGNGNGTGETAGARSFALFRFGRGSTTAASSSAALAAGGSGGVLPSGGGGDSSSPQTARNSIDNGLSGVSGATAAPPATAGNACMPLMGGYRQCLEVNPDAKVNCTWALDKYMKCREDMND